MATVETARDVEIQRALVEIQQRLQQMDTEAERHPVNVKALQAQVNMAVATAFLAGAAVVTVCVTIATIVLHAVGKL